MSVSTPTKRRRSDGERSRQSILLTATQLATVEGLEGLSIGRLAEASGMSKSGLYAHFGSKEELQLATVETAGEIFNREVVAKGMEATEGRARILALTDAFLEHLKGRVFPGGCFFASAAAEFDTRPGRVLAEIAAFQRGWMGLMRRCVVEARKRGEIGRRVEPTQLAFEVNAMLVGANSAYLLTGEVAVLNRARRGIERLLDTA
jgi:AcrR family transcriptional regulator